MKKRGYIEPVDYFPKNIRKNNKLGEYAEEKDTIRENLKKADKKDVDTLIKKRK